MKESIAEEVRIETATALATVLQAQAQAEAQAERQYPAYLGLDVHKETIAVAVARSGRKAPESRGEIAKDRLQHQFGCGLYDAVNHRRDAQSPFTAIGLRDQALPHRQGRKAALL
jgi:hypothetical protein